MRRRAPPQPSAARPIAVHLPPGLRAVRQTIGDEELAILSFPLPTVSMPAVLTPAERLVALDLLDGKSNPEIARARGTSARTIANQVAAIFRKLGVASRSDFAYAMSKLGRD